MLKNLIRIACAVDCSGILSFSCDPHELMCSLGTFDVAYDDEIRRTGEREHWSENTVSGSGVEFTWKPCANSGFDSLKGQIHESVPWEYDYLMGSVLIHLGGPPGFVLRCDFYQVVGRGTVMKPERDRLCLIRRPLFCK